MFGKGKHQIPGPAANHSSCCPIHTRVLVVPCLFLRISSVHFICWSAGCLNEICGRRCPMDTHVFPRRVQKYTTTVHREVILSTVITWSFRLRLSTPLYAHAAYTAKLSAQSETSPTQAWTANIARPPCAERPEGSHPGGYAGVRLGEAQNPGPAERDSAQNEPCPRRTRINEAGDADPGSQDFFTGGTHNPQLANIPAAQPDHADRPSVMTPNPRRPTRQWPRHQRAFLRCAECGADPHAYVGGSDNGLMAHMGQKHGGQSLIQERGPNCAS